jgi:hypothetical protein
VRC